MIKLSNVSYKYPGTDLLVLKNINLQINKGDFVGVIGRSGSGKSTLIDLLLGLLVPTSGSLEIDNNLINAEDCNWSKNIGYVSQDIHLLDESIKKNIAFGMNDDDIDINRVNECIKYAHLTEYINNLPKNIESKVGDKGIKLSGGQKQRIGIARALYNKPTILIFDEATSSLDSETEKKVISEINLLNENHTIISIAHRLSTLENCNKIMEISKGKIYEKN